jgi:hypothetical protein
VDVCTVLPVLLNSKRDNAFKMHNHSFCMHKQEIRDFNSGLVVYTLTIFLNLQQCNLQTSRQNVCDNKIDMHYKTIRVIDTGNILKGNLFFVGSVSY